MPPLIALLLLSLLSPSAHAGMHKWVDAEGKVHYSDTPPPDVNAESVRNMSGKGQQASPVDYSPKSYAEREAELRKSRQEKQETLDKQAKEKAQQEERQRACAYARESLRVLESGGRIATTDAAGERVFLDDEALEQRKRDVRRIMEQANCD